MIRSSYVCDNNGYRQRNIDGECQEEEKKSISRSGWKTSIHAPPVRDRWLYPYLDHSPARYAVMQHSMMFLCRAFRTYPRMMSRKGNVLPFMHPAQVSGPLPLPLANCFTLSRMWEGRNGDGGLMEEIVCRELNKLFNEVTICNSALGAQ